MNGDDPITDDELDELVEQGFLEHNGIDESGNKLYTLTPLGSARAESYIMGTVEGADLWARLQESDPGGNDDEESRRG